jgi:hypothetical protein
MEANFQRIAKTYITEFDIAKKYYTIIFTLNDIHLTKNEINLVAFSAVNGTLSTPPIKQQFCEQFDVPSASVYNIIGKLKKLNILIKDRENKIRINPVILPDFAQHTDIILVIKMLKENGTA